jgi:hypothetical protein
MTATADNNTTATTVRDYLNSIENPQRLIRAGVLSWVTIRDRDMINELLIMRDAMGRMNAVNDIAVKYGVCIKTVYNAESKMKKPIE